MCVNNTNRCSLFHWERTPAFIRRRFPEGSAAAMAGHLDSESVKSIYMSLDLPTVTDTRGQIPTVAKDREL